MADVNNTCAAGSIYFSREKAYDCATELSAKAAGSNSTYTVKAVYENISDGLPARVMRTYYEVIAGTTQKAGAKKE